MAQTDNGIRIISTAADGTQGNAGSGTYNGGSFYTGTDSFSISADGTKVAFMSDASNLVPGDANGTTDIFVKDLTTGAITLASTSAVALSLPWTPQTSFARSLNPSISPDGTKVAFAATPFINGAPSGPSQIIVKDLVTGTFTTLTRDRLASVNPVFSPDGTKIAFYSAADLTNAGTGKAGGLYLTDLSTGAIRLVSLSATGKPGNGISSEPTFSPDGTKLAFTSLSTNLGPTTRTGLITDTDVYVKDLITGAVTVVSTDASGQRGTTTYNNNTESANPAFSPDGTKVAFQSSANNLVPGDWDDTPDIFIKDLTTGAVTRVTTLANGASQGGYGPAFSPDGTKLAFWSSAPGYTPYPHAAGISIYMKDLVTGAFTLVSAPVDPAVPGDGNSQDPQFSADGSEIVFFSDNDKLVATDTNGHTADVFVKTLSTTTPVSPPTAVSDSYTTAQGMPLTVAAAAGLLANDTDPNGKPLTAVLVGNPAHGALTLSSDGSFTYTPAMGYSGADAFTYKASEGALQSTAATVSLTVTAAIDHPVIAVDDSYAVSNAFPSADFTVAAAAGLLANDTAPDGGLVAVGIVVNGTVQTGFAPTVAGGRAIVFPDGRLLYDQPLISDAYGQLRYNGLDSFVYRVRDADGSTADATVTLTVGSGVNHPVTAVDDSYTVSNAFPSAAFIVKAAAGLLANDTSLDGGLVALGIVVNGVVQTGTVRTAAGGRASIFPDGTLSYDQPFSEDDVGRIRYNGLDSFVYRVRDADGSTADATVTLTVGSGVNHPVTAVDDSYTVSNAFPSAAFIVKAAAGLLANDTSLDGGLVALGIVVNGVVQTGTVRTAAGGRASIFPDGTLSYDQPFSEDDVGRIRYNGLDSFVYRVRDADGSTADATVTLTVGSGVNHPVTAVDDSYTVSNAFPSAAFIVKAAAGLLANDTSLDGGLVALGIVVNGVVQTGTVRTATGGRASIFPDGTLSYDQPFSEDDIGRIRYNGLDSFVYRVRDADGSTADATVTLTVGSGVNHPVTAVDDSYTVSNAFPSAAFIVKAAAGLLANDTSLDGGLVALGIVVNGVVQTGTVRTAAGGRASIFPDGTLSYDQPFSEDDVGRIRYNGLDSFVYRVRDADGSTADATVTLTVGSSGINYPVTANDDSYMVANSLPAPYFTVPVAAGLLANDTAPDGGLVALGAVVNGVVHTDTVRTAAGGSVDVLPNGTFTYYQPFSVDAQGIIYYNGLDSFTYRVRDANGSTADATVTLTVGDGVDRPVTANADSYVVANSLPAPYFTTSAVTGLLANDTAPDGGLVALGAVVNGVVHTDTVRTAAGGSVDVLPNGTFTYYQPFSVDAQGIIYYNGLDSFTYRVRDANGSTADATVTLTVGDGVDRPVTANADSYVVANSLPAPYFTTSAVTGLLANDTAPDGGLVALGAVVNGVVHTDTVRTAAGGSVDVLPNGTFTYYQPFSVDAQGIIYYNGLDSFTYRVRDANGSTADATVTLTVGDGGQTRLTKGADTVVGTSADDLINVGTQTLSVGDRIDGGGGTNHLELVGGGIFNLNVPTVLTNIQVIDAQEGQAASGGVAATNQSITLRSGLDVTVNVKTAALNPANPKAPTITINGADDASRINLGAGNDIVTVGGVRETVTGGTGNHTIQVTAATIGATIDGGSGKSSLYVLGGGSNVTMGPNITRIATVVLAGSPGAMSFIANGEAGLTVNDMNKGADTISAGGLNQTLTGGNGSVTFVGFAGGATIFKNSAATMNGDKIANFFAPGSQIDLTDMNYGTLQPLRFNAGILQVNDGTHFAAIGLTGAVPAGAFVTRQDSGGGTLISYQR